MMMTFICSCRNKKWPNAIYPLGTSDGPSGDKESLGDSATITPLMVLCYLFSSFGWHGVALSTYLSTSL
jgi:hypothetical protein